MKLSPLEAEMLQETEEQINFPKLIFGFPVHVNSPNKLKSYSINLLKFQVEIYVAPHRKAQYVVRQHYFQIDRNFIL
jgi:hypothetical protein